MKIGDLVVTRNAWNSSESRVIGIVIGFVFDKITGENRYNVITPSGKILQRYPFELTGVK